MTRREGLVRGSCTLNAVNPVAAVLVLVEIVGVQDDVCFTRAAERIGFDAPGRSPIVQVDTEAIGCGKADYLKVCLSRDAYG